MKESYEKGVAIHLDPESWTSVGNDGRKALTGACAGLVLSLETDGLFPSADVLLLHGRQHHDAVIARQEWVWLGSVLRGYYQYHAVPGNLHALESLRWNAVRAWYERGIGRLAAEARRFEQAWTG